ncbi:MAG: DMT family transporter, partial [Proteobacteria bacterium]|nr:DMT family transporter [Pseudomonadota bacterium]
MIEPDTSVMAAGVDRVGRGIAYMLGAAFFFSVANVLVKLLTAGFSVSQVMFFRNLLGVLPCLVVVLYGADLGVLRIKRPFGLGLRALAGLGSTIFLFNAFALLPVADVVALTFSSGLFVTALSVPVLGEHVGPRRWAAVVVGFFGVLIVVQPGFSTFHPASLFGIGAAVCFALTAVLLRNLRHTENSLAIVFHYQILVATAALPVLIFDWMTPRPVEFALFVALGLSGGMAQFLMTRAYLYAPVAVIAPYDYTMIVWTALFGYLLLGDVITIPVAIGAMLVIASGLYILHRETQSRRVRATVSAAD